MTTPIATPHRWHIERAGTPGAYLPGWFAERYDGEHGRKLDTHAEAIAYVAVMIRRAEYIEAAWRRFAASLMRHAESPRFVAGEEISDVAVELNPYQQAMRLGIVR